MVQSHTQKTQVTILFRINRLLEYFLMWVLTSTLLLEDKTPDELECDCDCGRWAVSDHFSFPPLERCLGDFIPSPVSEFDKIPLLEWCFRSVPFVVDLGTGFKGSIVGLGTRPFVYMEDDFSLLEMFVRPFCDFSEVVEGGTLLLVWRRAGLEICCLLGGPTLPFPCVAGSETGQQLSKWEEALWIQIKSWVEKNKLKIHTTRVYKLQYPNRFEKESNWK